MNEFKELIEALTWPARHPQESVRREIMRTGKKAVGCFLGLLPEELIDAAGFLPVGLWGQETELLHAQEYFPAFFCAPIKELLEFGIRGAYDGLLCAMVMPVYCDALRSAGQNFKTAVPGIPMIPIVYPANRRSSSGKKFLASEYRQAGKRLCEAAGCGQPVSENRIEASIRFYNQFRRVMRDFIQAAGKHPEIMTPTLRHSVIKSSYYVDKRAYTQSLEQLTSYLNAQPVKPWSGKKVILTGIYLEEPAIFDELEAQNIAVAADSLLQESLQFQNNVPGAEREDGDVYYRLACRFSNLSGCSVAMDPQKSRVTKLVEEAIREGAGVIVCTPSFCDPEEYDYPVIKKALDEAKIPYICLELSDSSAAAQSRTKIQTFAEM